MRQLTLVLDESGTIISWKMEGPDVTAGDTVTERRASANGLVLIGPKLILCIHPDGFSFRGIS